MKPGRAPAGEKRRPAASGRAASGRPEPAGDRECAGRPLSRASVSNQPEPGGRRGSDLTLAWRLQDLVWRGVETVLRRIRLGGSELGTKSIAPVPATSPRPATGPGDAASALFGRGRPDSMLTACCDPMPTGCAFASGPPCEVLVVGRGDVVGDVFRRLLAEDVCVHAVAMDADERQAMIAMGVTPHRFADLPHQAAGFDVLISTDPMQIVEASILARLPERAAIVDLAPPPGSVDYENARLMGHEVVWSPPPLGGRSDRLDAQAWSRVRTALRR